jgi:hypothetical protein
MNKSLILTLMVFCVVVFGNNRVFAQGTATDSTQLQKISTNMIIAFNKVIGQQSRLYNGPAVNPYSFRSTTNANFKDTTVFNYGWVNYDGVVYNNIPLIYNIDRDMLESTIFNGFATYSFLSNRVSEFELLDHHFIRLDSLNKLIKAGFYDELYHNKLLLLAKRTKEIQQESASRGAGEFFLSNNYYYLKKGAVYYEVGSQGKILDVLKDKKKELKQYIKDNKIRYGDNPEHAMVMLSTYYDHLTN